MNGLAEANYEGTYLESIGGYGRKTDPARAGGQPRRAIFEIRGIPLAASKLPDQMLRIYDAVQTVSQRGGSG